MRWIAAVVLATVASTMMTDRAAAASLAAQLDDLIRKKGFQATDTVVPVLVQTVARGADFPTTASGPDFAYEFNPEMGTLERSTRPLSPVLVEAAQTIGRHVLQIGGSFLWSDFNRLDGALLRNTRATFTFSGQTPEGGTVPIPGALTFDRFHIEDFVFSGIVTYGLTERWDVGLVVPGVVTTLHASGRSQVRLLAEHETIPLDRFDIDDSKLGLGDIILRTKYVFEPGRGMSIAPTFALRIPSGNEDNFQGTGDLTLTPGVTFTRSSGRLGLFASLGAEVDPTDLERVGFRYGMAASVRLLESVSLITELTGRSGITDDTILVPFGSSGGNPLASTLEVPAIVPRSDVVDGSVGIKAHLLPHFVGYVSVLFPLVKDGVTAPVTPIGGIEYRF